MALRCHFRDTSPFERERESNSSIAFLSKISFRQKWTVLRVRFIVGDWFSKRTIFEKKFHSWIYISRARLKNCKIFSKINLSTGIFHMYDAYNIQAFIQ